MIHTFSKNGINLAIDVNSGAVHMVDELVYKILTGSVTSKHLQLQDHERQQLETEYGKSAVIDALAEIGQLISANLLFSEAHPLDEEVAHRPGIVKAICLHVAHDCNLSCAYCFASEGTFQGERSMMNLSTGKAAIDFLIRHSAKRTHLEVDFFGGEPLLNMPLVKEVVAYARSREQDTGKEFRFTLTTNALALTDENMAWINEHMSNVVLSLDGRPEINDQMRKCRNGEGSYRKILPNIKKMAALRADRPHFVRGTFTRENLDFANDVAHLVDQGFREISVEPVVAPPESPLSLRDEDCNLIEKEYDRLAELYLQCANAGQPFRFFHFIIDLKQGPCMKKRASGCGAGTEYVAITPEGDLYPCHQFVGNPDFCIGHVSTGLTAAETVAQFENATIYDKSECRECWAKYYCSGGCHANAWHSNGSLIKPYAIGCRLEKSRIETALMLVAKESEEIDYDQSP
ncbi:thioether cross-link-forming SCIFF peptide maturase [Anoxynatronum buryatiense]|uniref:Radical SAM core domain-containing protein n=1 Tax=Anoxynatronum buryatiense TaxID=489973 RepID=A0AA45WUR0_9CLOT|nr:thioether cross-link-forming SCIFF peptide maturase [Anoxynatronum buryatiense]SMP49396.1 uncharacterized protein SAMN06296020_103337 [Anoxynatronum buryatiense]